MHGFFSIIDTSHEHSYALYKHDELKLIGSVVNIRVITGMKFELWYSTSLSEKNATVYHYHNMNGFFSIIDTSHEHSYALYRHNDLKLTGNVVIIHIITGIKFELWHSTRFS
jgi:hypothetical protein